MTIPRRTVWHHHLLERTVDVDEGIECITALNRCRGNQVGIADPAEGRLQSVAGIVSGGGNGGRLANRRDNHIRHPYFGSAIEHLA